MTEKRDTDSAFMDWGNMFSNFWSPMMDSWAGLFNWDAGQQSSAKQGRIGESLQATARMWQTMVGAMGQPEALETFKKATQITPEIALGFAQSCLSGFTDFQAHIHEWIKKRGEAKDPIDIQALDKEFLSRWKESYEKEFSQYLKVPQIGLTRFYQERAMHAADKANVFQSTLSEFLHMLYLPLEEAFKSLQEKMAEMAEEEGPLDEKSKTYYNLWVKLLEGHYMELFKQPEYIDSMTRTLNALEGYAAAREAVVNDFLKANAIPTHNELDDLYKEIYLLKKRIREYERKK
jgi:hypothetical protein